MFSVYGRRYHYNPYKKHREFGDLYILLNYVYIMQRKRPHTFDVVYEDTGEIIFHMVKGQVEWDHINDIDFSPTKAPPTSCTCDFSHGNWGCTCGAGRREIEVSRKISKGLIMKNAQEQ